MNTGTTIENSTRLCPRNSIHRSWGQGGHPASRARSTWCNAQPHRIGSMRMAFDWTSWTPDPVRLRRFESGVTQECW